MSKVSKREQMKDMIPTLTQRGNRCVARDSFSEADGPQPKRALLTKLLLDCFNAKIQPLGLSLVHARLGWDSGTSPDEAFAKLQQLGLLDQRKHVDPLPPANLPLVQ